MGVFAHDIWAFLRPDPIIDKYRSGRLYRVSGPLKTDPRGVPGGPRQRPPRTNALELFRHLTYAAISDV